MMRMKRAFGRHFLLVLACAVIFAVAASPTWSAQSDYNGTYAGTYTGDDDGFWVAVAPGSSSAAVFLSYSTTYDQGDGGYLAFGGETVPVGNFWTLSTLFQGTYTDAYVNSSSGSVTGDWSNSSSGDSGTLTGSEILSCPQAGSYSGTFGGDDTGTWSLTIDANCYITGSMTSSTGSGTFEGGCHPNNHALMVGTSTGGDDFGVFGTISGSSFSGTWAAETGDSGTITSGSSSSSSGGGGGGGGGGCFILSLLGD